MNMSRLRSASALPLLLLVACATINVDPPALPEMPAAPEVVLSTPPMRPSVVPRPPAPPSYSLPKVKNVAWQTVWQEDFVNDSSPKTLTAEELSPAALVIPIETPESARLGMVSGLLSIQVGAADMGRDTAAALHMEVNGEGAQVVYSLDLLDPIGRWIHSPAFQTPAVKTAFVVRVYSREQVSKRVVKFNIQPFLQQLAEYNEKVVFFQSKREAYIAERAKYDQQFVDYLQAMQAWQNEMTALIEKTRRQHEADSNRLEAEYRARFNEYRKKAEQAEQGVAGWPELEHKPFQGPVLPEPRTLEAAAVPGALATLPLDDMRELLLNTATELVPATSVRLGGQFVDVGSGLTIATVDATLVLPTGTRKTEATMLRELMQRIAR
jgi:hypothetical protein